MEGAPLAQENLSTGTINPPTFSLASETVSLPDIGMVSAKTFGFGEGDVLHPCIVAPPPFFQSNFSNTWSDLNSGAGFHRLPAGNWNRSPNLIGTLGHDVPRTHDQTLSPSSGPQLIDHDSAPLAQAADGQSSGTSSATFSLTSETVTSPGSGLVFVNKYGSGVKQAFHDCIIAAGISPKAISPMHVR